MSNKEVTVTITPNGYADAIVDDKFVMPLEETMKFSDFVDKIEGNDKSDGSNVYYIQKQNSNLTDEFGELMDDVEEIEWASEAFGKEPDAINFWMGEEKAVTSSKISSLKVRNLIDLPRLIFRSQRSIRKYLLRCKRV